MHELQDCSERISKILDHVGRGRMRPCGFTLTEQAGVVHWPSIMAKTLPFKRFSELVLPEAQRHIEAAKQLLDSQERPSGLYDADYLHWWARRTRELFEAALGALVLPAFSEEHRVNRRSIRASDGASLTSDEYDHADDFTVFRRLRNQPSCIQRTLLWPEEPLEHYTARIDLLPAPLIPLLYAWYTLSQRHLTPFDSWKVGIDYTSSGYLIVNWTLFAQSEFWPHHLPRQIYYPDSREVTKLDQAQYMRPRKPGRKRSYEFGAVPDAGYMPTALKTLPRYCGLGRALLPLTLDSGKADITDAVTLSALSTGLITVSATGHVPSCSVIDLSALPDPQKLFDGTRYDRLHRLSRARHQEQQRRQQQHTRAVSNARVFRFTFTPSEWFDEYLQPEYQAALAAARHGDPSPKAQDAAARYPWLFAYNASESIYAVKRKGEWCFTPPTELVQSPIDAEMWRRALDSVNLVESLRLDRVDPQDPHSTIMKYSRSQCFKQAREELLLEFADDATRLVIEAAAPGTHQKLRELKARAQHAYNLETGIPGFRWYHDRVLREVVKRNIDPELFRHQIFVDLSAYISTESGEPQQQTLHFFTTAATDVFKRFAAGSFKELVVDGPEHPRYQHTLNFAALRRIVPTVTHGQERLFHNLPGAAAYLLAWVRFCEAQRAAFLTNGDPQPLREAPTKKAAPRSYEPWTPAQDIYLLTTFRRYPRMSNAERQQLRTALGRSEIQWRLRRNYLRVWLPRTMHPTSWQALGFEKNALTEVAAKRAVLGLGLLREICQFKLADYFQPSKIPPVLKALHRLSPDQLINLVVPTSYRHDPAWGTLSRQLLGQGVAAVQVHGRGAVSGDSRPGE